MKHPKLDRFWQEWRWPLLGMAAPFSLLWIAFAWFGMLPFGDNAPIVVDGWHQYYPFLLELQRKLQSGGSLLHSWTMGLGVDFVTLSAYYLASPLNLLVLLVRPSAMRFVYTLLISVKIGAAGLCCSLFLQRVFDRKGLSVSAFGCCYALCGFFMGYFWNIMWLDSVALFPLVVLGLVALVREGKWKLYTAALALAVWCNYLIGLYICIFVLLAFFLTCLGCGVSGRLFFRRLGRIALCSAVALALCGALLLPAVYGLQATSISGNAFSHSWKPQYPLFEVLGGLSAFTRPTTTEGLPNLYSGLPCMALGALFLAAGPASRRNRLASGILLGVLLLSVNIDSLEYVWNGFRDTNMLPYRFSFMVSFVLAVMAFQALPAARALTLPRLAVLLSAGGLAVYGAFVREDGAWGANALLLCAYLAALAALKKDRLRAWARAALAVLLCAELLGSTLLGVKTVGATSSVGYPWRSRDVKYHLSLLAEDDSFYRVELAPSQSLNDPALLGFRGMSVFSSTVSAPLSQLMDGLGMAATRRGNRYYTSQLGTPLTGAMFSVKYFIHRDVPAADSDLLPVFDSGQVYTYENPWWLPVAFAAHGDMEGPLDTGDSPFAAQNGMFARLTGLDIPIFYRQEPADQAHSNLTVQPVGRQRWQTRLQDSAGAGEAVFVYDMPRAGSLYLYVESPDAHRVAVSANGGAEREFVLQTGYPHILCAGAFEAGDRVTVRWTVAAGSGPSYAQVNAALFDREVFSMGHRLLEDEGLQVEAFTDTSVTGTVTLLEEGYLYTSIPYAPGWRLYVDGRRRDITPWQGAFVALEGLEAGTHRIELRYVPAGLIPGGLLSAAALGACLVMARAEGRRNRKEP